MDYTRHYKGYIWTNHALERLRQRNIPQSHAWATLNNPEKSSHASTKGGIVYERTWSGTRIKVVAKKNQRGEWVVLSAWSSTSKSQSPSLPILLVLLALLVLLIYAYVR